MNHFAFVPELMFFLFALVQLPDLQNVVVMSTNNYEDGRRKFDKKYFCLYCEKSVSKMPRHLVKLHYTEAAVIDFVHEKDPLLKDAKLAKLRNLGRLWKYLIS